MLDAVKKLDKYDSACSVSEIKSFVLRQDKDNIFTPINFDKINIQLWSDNNEEFDSQNTDNSFEFEFTSLSA